MTEAEITIKVLYNKVSDILEGTDWNPEGMKSEIAIKMIEAKGSFVRLLNRLEDTKEIIKAMNGKHQKETCNDKEGTD